MTDYAAVITDREGKVLYKSDKHSSIESFVESLVQQGKSLENCDLAGCKFAGHNLKGANFKGANLTKANLLRANLTDANLTGANLTGANLAEASMPYVNLRRVDLTEANLIDANLIDADLAEANMPYVNLLRTDLTGANLTGAYLRRTNLTGAYLSGARMADDLVINKTPIQIQTPVYWIIIFDNHMGIGCQLHLISEWFKFDDRKIIEMDNRRALNWWNQWKPLLHEICRVEKRG